jgi:hypothetical protein
MADQTEAEKARECLGNIMTWMREPDWIEHASVEWLMDWINRRPLADLGMAIVLNPKTD